MRDEGVLRIRTTIDMDDTGVVDEIGSMQQML